MSYTDDVAAFHKACDVPMGGKWGDRPTETRRLNLINEEFAEYQEAMIARDPAAALDALIDLVYVALGAGIEYFGPDAVNGAWDAVQRANMAKVGPGGKVRKRADGKILKPFGWQAPDLRPFVGEHT